MGLFPWVQLLRSRRLLLLGVLVLLLLSFGFGVNRLARVQRHAQVTATALDQRLVVHARTVTFSSVLAGRLRLRGSLYPALPGRNVLHVSITQPGMGRPLDGRIALVAVMPGMRMTPTKAAFAMRVGGSTGALMLPMFGSYQAQVTVITPDGSVTGALLLTLPLILG